MTKDEFIKALTDMPLVSDIYSIVQEAETSWLETIIREWRTILPTPHGLMAAMVELMRRQLEGRESNGGKELVQQDQRDQVTQALATAKQELTVHRILDLVVEGELILRRFACGITAAWWMHRDMLHSIYGPDKRRDRMKQYRTDAERAWGLR